MSKTLKNINANEKFTPTPGVNGYLNGPIQQAVDTASRCLDMAGRLNRWNHAAEQDVLVSKASALLMEAMNMAHQALENAKEH